jgi:hypothetical protein
MQWDNPQNGTPVFMSILTPVSTEVNVITVIDRDSNTHLDQIPCYLQYSSIMVNALVTDYVAVYQSGFKPNPLLATSQRWGYINRNIPQLC